jgi:hypothetical protein
MKKIIGAMFIICLFALASCQKDETNSSVPSTKVDTGTPDPGDSGQQTKAGMTGYAVSPRFGKPNSTYYSFKVYDLSGTLTLSVKLYDRASGTITYLPMSRIGTYWMLSTKLANNGWFDYNYVYSSNKNVINSSATYSCLCNSKNVFSSTDISSIFWPFGADGSSWTKRTISINGISQTWQGGQEGGSGDGWGEGSHTGNEQYSDDWNRGTTNQDENAIIRSPLDGYIDVIGYDNTSYGDHQSLYVTIIQQASDGNLYRFYVGHLKTRVSNLCSGKYVRAGIDQIGTLGKSGASSPHAHTSLKKVVGSTKTSVKFYFSAQ